MTHNDRERDGGKYRCTMLLTTLFKYLLYLIYVVIVSRDSASISFFCNHAIVSVRRGVLCLVSQFVLNAAVSANYYYMWSVSRTKHAHHVPAKMNNGGPIFPLRPRNGTG